MVGGVIKKVAPDAGSVSDVGGSDVGVVRSRRLVRWTQTTHMWEL